MCAAVTEPLELTSVVSPPLFCSLIEPKEFSMRCRPLKSRASMEPCALTNSLAARTPAASMLPKRFFTSSGALAGTVTSRSTE